MAYRGVVVSDLRVPFTDWRAVNSLLGFITEYQPDDVVILGGLVDEDAAATDPDGAADLVTTRLVEPLHSRANTRVVQLGPMCIDLPGIEQGPEFSELIPGWFLVANTATTKHAVASSIPANTALRFAKRLGKSVVIGGTCRLGAATWSTGYDGAISFSVTGVEVGNLLDPLAAKHRPTGLAESWQQGFGLIDTSGDPVVQPIRINRRGRILGLPAHAEQSA